MDPFFNQMQWIYNLAGAEIGEMCDPNLKPERYGELVKAVCLKTGLRWPLVYDIIQGLTLRVN